MVSENSLAIARGRTAVIQKERERVFQQEVLRIKEEMNGRNVLHSSMTQTKIADAIRRELETRSSQFLEVFKRILPKEDSILIDLDASVRTRCVGLWKVRLAI